MLYIVLFISTASCSSGDWFKTKVKVFDKEVCVPLGVDGGFCSRTLSNKTRKMTQTEMAAWLPGKFCTDSRGFTDTEAAIDEFCENYGVCDYVVRQEMKAMAKRMKALKARSVKTLQQWYIPTELD